MELSVTGLEHSFPVGSGGDEFTLGIGRLCLSLGEVTYVMGHNGSGKSVLLKRMTGELLSRDRVVRFHLAGNDWTASSGRCGIVRQRAEESLAVDLTVAENLILRLSTRSLVDRFHPNRRLRDQAFHLVRWHGELARKLNQRCGELSMGQRQTVAFIAVAARRRRLLLLDEYLSSTDRSTSSLLCVLARQYAVSIPAAVVVVSHDVPLALEQADRILVLRRGELFLDMRRGDSVWNPAQLAAVLSPPADEEGTGSAIDVPTAFPAVPVVAGDR